MRSFIFLSAHFGVFSFVKFFSMCRLVCVCDKLFCHVSFSQKRNAFPQTTHLLVRYYFSVLLCHIIRKLVQLLFPKLSNENVYKNALHKHKQVQTQNTSKFKKPSKGLTIIVTKIVFIAACILAVTANTVRVAQDQDDGNEQQNNNYEQQNTDYEPKKTDYQPSASFESVRNFLMICFCKA